MSVCVGLWCRRREEEEEDEEDIIVPGVQRDDGLVGAPLTRPSLVCDHTHISVCACVCDDGGDDLRRSIAAGARAGPEYAPQPARHDRLSPLECHLVSVARVAAVSGSFGKPSLASWWPYIALIVRHTQRELGGLTKNHFSLTHRMLPTEPNVIKRFNSLVSLSLSLSLSIPQSINQSGPIKRASIGTSKAHHDTMRRVFSCSVVNSPRMAPCS